MSSMKIFHWQETRLTKNGIPPEPYLLRLCSAVRRGRKLTFTAIDLVPLKYQFDAFFNPGKTTETNATNKQHPANLKDARVLAPPLFCLTLNFGDNANHSHSDRYQPLPDRKARSTQHLPVEGYQMTRMHAYRCSGCIHKTVYCLVFSYVRKTKIGVKATLLPRQNVQMLIMFGSGAMPFSVRRSFDRVARYCTGNSVDAAENTKQ